MSISFFCQTGVRCGACRGWGLTARAATSSCERVPCRAATLCADDRADLSSCLDYLGWEVCALTGLYGLTFSLLPCPCLPPPDADLDPKLPAPLLSLKTAYSNTPHSASTAPQDLPLKGPTPPSTYRSLNLLPLAISALPRQP